MKKRKRKIVSIICCFSMLFLMYQKNDIFADNSVEEPIIEEVEEKETIELETNETTLEEEKEIKVLPAKEIVEKEVEAPITIEKNIIYANGVAIVIKKGNDGKIYIYNNNGELLTPEAITATTVYGGSKNATVNGSTSVTVENVSGLTVYGGGYSDGSGVANVIGNTTVMVKGNCDVKDVYGGGNATATKQNAVANVLGSTTLKVEATPVSNHGSIHGGGYAVVTAGYNAEASVQSTNVSFVGRTYVGYGGGYATTASNSTGKAVANVSGDVIVNVNNADARELYAGGYSVSYGVVGRAEANARSVTTTVNNSELMIFVGAGDSHGGIANVETKVTSTFNGCYLYGSLVGGGKACVGGIANVANAELSIIDSDMPIDTQWGEYVSTGVYGGGYAASGTAKVFNNVKLSIIGGTSAATIVGGGNAIKNGTTGSPSDCSVGNIEVVIDGVKASYYSGVTTPFKSSVIAGGDCGVESVASHQGSTITIKDSELEDIVGGQLLDNQYASSSDRSSLISDYSAEVNGIYYLDDIYLKDVMTVNKVVGKTDTTATKVHYPSGIKGTPLFSYMGDNPSTNWFYMNRQDVLYKDNVFSIGDTFYMVNAKNNTGGSISSVGDTKVYEGKDITYSINTNVGYKILRVYVDNQEAFITNNQYTFRNISGDHTINVVFLKESPQIVIPPNPQVPDIEIKNPDQLSSLYSDEDKELIAQGKEVTFALDVGPVETPKEEVSVEIKKELQNTNFVIAGYLDISFNKMIDHEKHEMSTINQALELTLDIPAQFILNQRKFSILRVHQLDDGSYNTEVLEDIDNDPNTITFNTDKFSIYSLVYEDPKLPDIILEVPILPETPIIDIPEENTANNKTVDTGDYSNITLYVTMLMSSILVILYIYKKY